LSETFRTQRRKARVCRGFTGHVGTSQTARGQFVAPREGFWRLSLWSRFLNVRIFCIGEGQTGWVWAQSGSNLYRALLYAGSKDARVTRARPSRACKLLPGGAVIPPESNGIWK
jgi:hypothetical protein